MEAALVKKLLNEKGKENLLFININNNRRYHVDKANLDRLFFDFERECIVEFNNDFVLAERMNYTPHKVVSFTPFEFIEGLYFLDDDKHYLSKDKDGKEVFDSKSFLSDNKVTNYI